MTFEDVGYPQLRDYLSILWQRKLTVIAVTFLAAVTAFGYSISQTPLYQSAAEVIVRPVNLSALAPSTSPGWIVMETEQRLASSGEVRARAIETGGPQTRSASLAVELVTDSEVLVFRATSSDPSAARALAQSSAEAYLSLRLDRVVSDLEGVAGPIEGQIADLDQEISRVQQRLLQTTDDADELTLQAELSSLLTRRNFREDKLNELTVPAARSAVGQIVTPAFEPTEPVSPNPRKDTGLGLVAGLLLGTGLAFLKDRLDDRIRNRGDLETHAGAPTVSAIARVPNWKNRRMARLIMLHEADSDASEGFRSLRASVLFLLSQMDGKSLMVTSSHAGEGKSTVAANLAVALAQAGKRVILVSGDLRRPRVHEFFGVPAFTLNNGVGLSDLLADGRDPLRALMKLNVGAPSTRTRGPLSGTENGRSGDGSSESLRLLPSGHAPANPAELLSRDEAPNLIAQLEDDADIVLIDTAPVLAAADSMTLAPLVSGILLVADAKKATRRAVDEARHKLTQVGGRLLIGVLNNCDRRQAQGHYGRYEAYRRQEPAMEGGLSTAAEPIDRSQEWGSVVPVGKARKTEHGS
jgi:polysaccharide biosynthesis transport protein